MVDVKDLKFGGDGVLKLVNALNKNTDEFKQKIRILDKEKIEGSEKKDSNGNVLIDNTTGEVLRWDDKYKITYMAVNTASERHAIYVPFDKFEELKIGEDYFAIGRVDYKKVGNDYSSRAVVSFDKFINVSEQIYEVMRQHALSQSEK